MKQRKPAAPWLPGHFGKMSRTELDAESDQYDAEFAALDAKRGRNRRRHPRKRGSRKTASGKSARVQVTMTSDLLAAADAVADRRGLSRADLVRQAIQDWLAHQSESRKSA